MSTKAAGAEAGADVRGRAMAKATTPAASYRKVRRKVDRFLDRHPDITETDMLTVMGRLNRREWTFADVKAIVLGGKIDG